MSVLPAAPARRVVVLTRQLPDSVARTLVREFELRGPLFAGSSAHEQVLRRALDGADALVSTVADPVPASLLRSSHHRLRIVANFGVGVNNIALDAAREQGIAVTNTPDVLTEDTADLTVALLLAAARRLGEGERLVRSGAWTGWEPTQLLGTRVHGKTLGIVGYGRIGRAVARRAHLGFGMRVLYHQRTPLHPNESDPARAIWRDELHALLAESDFVSLHVPATASTRQLIDAAALSRLPRHAVLVNTARGDVIDEEALTEALRDHRIAAAGMDVYEREPAVPSALRELDNVVLLPHLGSATEQTRAAMGCRVLENLRACFAGVELPDRVV